MGVQRTWSCWGGHSSSGSGVGSRWADALLFLFRNLIEDSAIAAIVWREREREREESCSCSSVKIKQLVPVLLLASRGHSSHGQPWPSYSPLYII